MTRDVLTTWPGESLADAVNRMLDHHVHRLVVVEGENQQHHPVGMLSMSDLARIH